jgi:putative transposase
LRGLLDRGLIKGLRLVVSDDHEGIKAAPWRASCPGRIGNAARGSFSEERVGPRASEGDGGGGRGSEEDLQGAAGEDGEDFGRGVLSVYEKSYPKAVSAFEARIVEVLTYLRYPGSHHARIRTTNVLERLFKEVRRRTKVIGVFPNEKSASVLATEITLRSSEEWAL